MESEVAGSVNGGGRVRQKVQPVELVVISVSVTKIGRGEEARHMRASCIYRGVCVCAFIIGAPARPKSRYTHDPRPEDEA